MEKPTTAEQAAQLLEMIDKARKQVRKMIEQNEKMKAIAKALKNVQPS